MIFFLHRVDKERTLLCLESTQNSKVFSCIVLTQNFIGLYIDLIHNSMGFYLESTQNSTDVYLW